MPIFQSQSITTYQSWFRLKNVPGLGNILFKRLIKRFASPENVFSAPLYDLKQVRGMGARVISGIQNSRVTNEIKEQIRLIEKKGFQIVTLTDKAYPVLLKQIPDPPPYFTCIGTLENISPAIAIVGSRQATSYGLNTAEKLGYDLALKGFQVISGMALGIDTAAHEGALKAGGRTLAVLGSGLGTIYPRENRNLFHKIADNGAVISEFNVYASPEARHFPIRNRIISGISTGTVVVEAAARSGSLITARLAAEYDREVFAVPGNIHSSNSAGTHALLKQGAKLVENHGDVTEELYHMIHELSLPAREQTASERPAHKQTASGRVAINTKQGQSDPFLFDSEFSRSNQEFSRSNQEFSRSNQESSRSNQESSRSNQESNPPVPVSLFKPDEYQNEILSILGRASPLHIDTIIEQSAFNAGTVTAALLDLELSGMIKQKPGKMFYLQ